MTIRRGVLGLAALLLCGAVAAEVYVYQTPGGFKIYSDRVQNRPEYRPVNAAARRGVQPYTGPYRTAGSAPLRRSPHQREIEHLIERTAPEFALDPVLVKRVVEAESGYRVNAISPKNAQGLMQLIPATARRFGVRDSFDAEQNLRGGMAYLRFLLGTFRGDLRLALAGYNAGERAVLNHKGVPPYPETQAYVARILTRYGRVQHPYVITASAAAGGGKP